MRLFWIAMDTSTPWPWLIAAATWAAGYVAWRRVRPRIAAEWEAVNG